MKIDVLTIFPQLFEHFCATGIIKKAREKDILRITVHSLRDFSRDERRTVDDAPYGGGCGMVMKVEPFYRAIISLLGRKKSSQLLKKKAIADTEVIMFSPQGKVLKQSTLNTLSKKKHIILLCGRYEGFDERIRKHLITSEISIGDFVIQGGEIPAMALIEGVSRLIPGVIGREDSYRNESFFDGLLDYPQYTRPRVFRTWHVPPVLLEGNHKKIEQWRKDRIIENTEKYRPDLIKKKRKG